MGDVIALVDRDVYNMGQVDRLLGLSHGTACRWIDGYTRRERRYEPLVRLETTGSETVTWGEFVEARLISEYRRQGVSVFRMRPAIMALRDAFGTEYPLAAAQPFMSAEGRELVLQVQQETNLGLSLRFVIHVAGRSSCHPLRSAASSRSRTMTTTRCAASVWRRTL